MSTVKDVAPLQFEDVTARPRCGCKGPGAEAWLRSQGYTVPAAPNSAAIAAGVLVARLASSEFLIESLGEAGNAAADERVRESRTQLGARTQPRDVYPVARQDVVATVRGGLLNALLREVCSVDFAPLLRGSSAGAGGQGGLEQPIVLTSMIGVGVVAWPQAHDTAPAVTLWCEPSFGDYFFNTLHEVACDVDGSSNGGK